MESTFYRRPLPADAIAFASPEGRKLFMEALATGGLDGYFPLAEQFHTQSDPSFCGLGSLVVALNALGIDPGRLWRGPWRWFGEDLLDCCVSLDEVRARGLNLDELACLARCNGPEVKVVRAESDTVEKWRESLNNAATGRAVVIASYDRASLGQTGSGHFSPIGGYHAGRDLALVLDVARFKYPPHWVSAQRLWTAMQPLDPATNKPRGWLTLTATSHASNLAFTVSCKAGDWQSITRDLERAICEVVAAPDFETAARAALLLARHVERRVPNSAAHAEALRHATASVKNMILYDRVARAVSQEHADKLTLLLPVLARLVMPGTSAVLDALRSEHSSLDALSAEIESVTAQFEALRDYMALREIAPREAQDAR